MINGVSVSETLQLKPWWIEDFQKRSLIQDLPMICLSYSSQLPHARGQRPLLEMASLKKKKKRAFPQAIRSNYVRFASATHSLFFWNRCFPWQPVCVPCLCVQLILSALPNRDSTQMSAPSNTLDSYLAHVGEKWTHVWVTTSGHHILSFRELNAMTLSGLTFQSFLFMKWIYK